MTGIVALIKLSNVAVVYRGSLECIVFAPGRTSTDDAKFEVIFSGSKPDLAYGFFVTRLARVFLEMPAIGG